MIENVKVRVFQYDKKNMLITQSETFDVLYKILVSR